MWMKACFRHRYPNKIFIVIWLTSNHMRYYYIIVKSICTLWLAVNCALSENGAQLFCLYRKKTKILKKTNPAKVLGLKWWVPSVSEINFHFQGQEVKGLITFFCVWHFAYEGVLFVKINVHTDCHNLMRGNNIQRINNCSGVHDVDVIQVDV